MKRMVKNGDLIDVEPDGSITVAGKPVGGGGGIAKRELALSAPADFSDITEPDGQTTLQFTQAGNAKVDAFIEGINKNNVVSLYCSIFANEEIITGIREMERMYGTFDIPATARTEGSPGLCFIFGASSFFMILKVEGSYMGIMAGSSTSLSQRIGSISLSMFYM